MKFTSTRSTLLVDSLPAILRGLAPDGGLFVPASPLPRPSGSAITLADAERTYTSRGYTVRAVFTADGVRVSGADCPSQDCVRTGEITRAGESIVCLPARIVITLTGGSPDFDVIAG